MVSETGIYYLICLFMHNSFKILQADAVLTHLIFYPYPILTPRPRPISLILMLKFFWDVGVSCLDRGPYIEIRPPQWPLNPIVTKFKLNISQICYYLVQPL